MVVQHNLPAMNSQRQLGINNSSTAKNLEKLSSGYKINRAGDDAAGLAISEKMRGQIRGLDMATQNAENAVSLIQTAEGALNETHSVLQRMRELSVQSSNGTFSNEVDRENINKEVQALKEEVERISTSTHYNGIKLLDGSMSENKKADVASATEYAKINDTTRWDSETNAKDTTNVINDADLKKMTFQIGANGSADQQISLNVNNMGVMNLGTLDTSKMGVAPSSWTATSAATGAKNVVSDDGNKVVDVDVSTQDNASYSIQILDAAINQVSDQRAGLGAMQNRLEHTINNLGVTSENLQAAESSIRDVDMAKEMMEFTKNNILTQASQAMLAQSNQLPQGVLTLLK